MVNKRSEDSTYNRVFAKEQGETSPEDRCQKQYYRGGGFMSRVLRGLIFDYGILDSKTIYD